MAFVVFAVVLLALLVGANLFINRRAAKVFGIGRSARRVILAVQIAGIAALFIGRVLLRLLPSGAAAAVAGFGWVLELAVILVAVLMLLERGAAWILARAAGLGRTPAPNDAPAAAAEGISRRQLISQVAAGTAIAAGAGAAGYGGLFGRHDYVLEEVPVRLAKLPRALDGFTIAQLSDIHLGLFVGEPEMKSAIALMRRAKPDLVAITGDMLDSHRSYAEALGRLVRALGAIAPVVAIPGNHDYYAGIEPVLASVRAAGGTVLLNRSILAGEGRIVVAGVDDLWAHRYGPRRGPNLDAALDGAPEDAARVLLAHQPVFFEEAAARVDLQISGHTHGGQFNPGVHPAKLVLPNGWVAGRYRVGNAELYVNRGFGTAGPPARLGSPPEVTKIILTSSS